MLFIPVSKIEKKRKTYLVLFGEEDWSFLLLAWGVCNSKSPRNLFVIFPQYVHVFYVVKIICMYASREVVDVTKSSDVMFVCPIVVILL